MVCQLLIESLNFRYSMATQINSRGMITYASLSVLNFMDVEQYSQQPEVSIISNIIL